VQMVNNNHNGVAGNANGKQQLLEVCRRWGSSFKFSNDDMCIMMVVA
jgi:hypothetical protein